MTRASAFVLLLAATPAAADCVTAQDLARGIRLGFADGSAGSATAQSGDLVRVVYSSGAQIDQRTAHLGIYEVTQTRSQGSAGGDVIGVWSGNEARMSLSGTPPVPAPGAGWQTVMSATFSQSDFTGAFTQHAVDMAVTYAFLPARTVTLSGCDHVVIPVEATFSTGDGPVVQRFAYFPDLGFGVETQLTYVATGRIDTNGLVAMERTP